MSSHFGFNLKRPQRNQRKSGRVSNILDTLSFGRQEVNFPHLFHVLREELVAWLQVAGKRLDDVSRWVHS